MAEKVEAESGKVIGYDGRQVAFDLLVTIPTNMGSELIKRSGLGDEMNYVPVDRSGFRSEKYADIFVIGDAAATAWTKGRAVAHLPLKFSIKLSWRRLMESQLRLSLTVMPIVLSRRASGGRWLLIIMRKSSHCPGNTPFRSSGRCRFSRKRGLTTGRSWLLNGFTGTGCSREDRYRLCQPG